MPSIFTYRNPSQVKGTFSPRYLRSVKRSEKPLPLRETKVVSINQTDNNRNENLVMGCDVEEESESIDEVCAIQKLDENELEIDGEREDTEVDDDMARVDGDTEVDDDMDGERW